MAARSERPRDVGLGARLGDLIRTSGPADAAPARRDFQGSIDRVDDELIGAAMTLVDLLPRATRALLTADHGAIEEICALTRDVQARCLSVEEHGFVLLAREAPVAGDLRRLVGVLRLVTATDRAAALVRHVAEAADHVDTRQLPREVLATLEELSSHALDVFRRGIDAWRQRDGLAVHEVNHFDEAVDRLQAQLLRGARRDVSGAAELLVLGLLGRYFERIADHGVAFAQHAAFAVTGTRVDVGRSEP